MLLLSIWLHNLQTRLKSDRGATAVEYGLLVAGIAALIVATVFLIGPKLDDMFKLILGKLG